MILQWLYSATWLWLPFLIWFLVRGLHCSPYVKFILYKIGLYYIVSAIALQLLVPASHLALRTLLFDLTTRVFLFINATEMLWFSWSAWRTGTYQQKPLPSEESSLNQFIWSAISALLYLGWGVLGVAFAFTLTPGI